jgi:hypothetical protein
MPPRSNPHLSPTAELARRARPAIMALRGCMAVNAMVLVGSLASFAEVT